MASSPVRLSTGQHEALRLTANGYTSKEIAKITGTSEQAIHMRIRAAMYTLDARTRGQAIAVALRLGIIQLGAVEIPARLADLPARYLMQAQEDIA